MKIPCDLCSLLYMLILVKMYIKKQFLLFYRIKCHCLTLALGIFCAVT